MSPESALAQGELEPAAHEMLASLGSPVVRATIVSPLRSTVVRKRCYRIGLADGRVVKLRRSSTEPEARAYADLVTALGDPRLARVLDRRGDLTVEEWVPGTPLDAVDAESVASRHGEAAALLGALHAPRRLGAIEWPESMSTEPAREQLERDLREVVSRGGLAADVVARLHESAARHDPGLGRAGIVHTDLCPENLVVDPAGTLRAIDNEAMRIGCVGFDLARVWYRWPMPDAAWRAYVDAYARVVDPAPALAHFPFWQIAAVAQSAALRLARWGEHAHVPLRRLVALAGAS